MRGFGFLLAALALAAPSAADMGLARSPAFQALLINANLPATAPPEIPQPAHETVGVIEHKDVPDRDAILAQMAGMIFACVQQGSSSKGGVFGNCFDWHSSVHAHWALFRLARADARYAALAAWGERALRRRELDNELKGLRDRPDFESPYGRAWLLRLTIEFENWARETGASDPRRLRPLGDEAARSLLLLYSRRAPTPDGVEYGNASWAMTQLHAYYRHTGDAQGLAEAQALIRAGFLKAGGPTFATDHGAPGFFSLFGNWAYLIARTQGEGETTRFLAEHPIADADLAPFGSPKYSHHYGLNWSRAWALRRLAVDAQSPHERQRFENSYEAHVAAAMKAHPKQAADYGYSHWVGQFAVYALTEGQFE